MGMKSRDEPGMHTSAYWHERAEEAYTLAEEMRDSHAKSALLMMAAMYDAMAKQAAKRESRLSR
jgi:hypothetical protein